MWRERHGQAHQRDEAPKGDWTQTIWNWSGPESDGSGLTSETGVEADVYDVALEVGRYESKEA